MDDDVVASLASRKNKLTLKLNDEGGHECGASFVTRHPSHTPLFQLKSYEAFDETTSLPQTPISSDISTIHNHKVRVRYRRYFKQFTFIVK